MARLRAASSYKLLFTLQEVFYEGFKHDEYSGEKNYTAKNIKINMERYNSILSRKNRSRGLGGVQ